ncbi:MAG: hypothetical protein HFK10_01595 [Clostridia bacterium]|jgi:hypothetical protein|nr:hypothetical protein [Clostridia bacterium]
MKRIKTVFLFVSIFSMLFCCSCAPNNPNELTYKGTYHNEFMGRCYIYATVSYKTNAKLKDRITFKADNASKSINGTFCNVKPDWPEKANNQIITLSITVDLDYNFLPQVVHSGEFSFEVYFDGEVINTETFSFSIE